MRTAVGSSPKNVKRCHDFHQVLPKHPQSTDSNPGMVTTCSQKNLAEIHTSRWQLMQRPVVFFFRKAPHDRW